MKVKQNHSFKIGETVVYPKHGVGEIINVEAMEVANIKTTKQCAAIRQFLKRNK